MRKRMMAFLMGLMLSVCLTGTAMAEYVYVTTHGEKYHTADSKFIKGKDVTRLTVEEAENQGYEPSRAFLKEQAAQKAVEGQKSKKK